MSNNTYPNPDIIVHTSSFKAYISTPPTFEQAFAFLRQKYGEGLPESLVREWYDDMEAICWTSSKGATCRNWPYWFYTWRKNRARFAALRAVPEQPRNGRTPPRADNYIRASEETIRKFREGFI